jgi:hypothetical protein
MLSVELIVHTPRRSQRSVWKNGGCAGVSRVNDVFKEGDAWTGCVHQHVCTGKKNRQKGIGKIPKTRGPKYIDQVLNESKKTRRTIGTARQHRRSVAGI